MLNAWQLVFLLQLASLTRSATLEPEVLLSNNHDAHLEIQPVEISLVVGETKTATFIVTGALSGELELTLNKEDAMEVTPNKLVVSPSDKSVTVAVKGLQITSFSILEVKQCQYLANTTEDCPISNVNRTFAEVRVVHSKELSILVIVVGWIYFLAWSISFYPQIWLNFKRKSVVGLNFDFLLLNIIGFACYTFYNVLMYFDANIQEIYESTHPHSHIPVLLNDVVFAVHALFACLVTALQCFFYQRGNQRVSYTCAAWSTILIAFSFISFLLSMFEVFNPLQFITMLSYVKMAVTLSKYFPQAFYNYRRKSTTGWSIGNVLLDFLGGSMDILQMILQAANSDDWSAFYGNPVKFGLGLVSMLFDIVFMVQHYILYRHATETLPTSTSDDQIKSDENADRSSIDTTPSDDGSNRPIMVDNQNNPVV